MKVISDGDPKGKAPSWAGQTVKCTCGFTAVLERGDAVQEHDHQRDPYIELKCPTCGGRIFGKLY